MSISTKVLVVVDPRVGLELDLVPEITDKLAVASVLVEVVVQAMEPPEDLEEVVMETITMLMDMVELTTPRWIGGETELFQWMSPCQTS